MDDFSISDFEIIWDKRTPKRDKVAIKADLKTMADIIDEAMTYTKDKRLKENRETEVRFWLKTKINGFGYYIEISYDGAADAWLFTIQDADTQKTVGQIISEKWPYIQLLDDEDVEAETF